MTIRETELLAVNAALEAEVLRLRGALDSVQQVANRSDGIAGWHLNGDIASWDSILPEVEDALSTPFTPTALHELIEKVEKMTIERCAVITAMSIIDMPTTVEISAVRKYSKAIRALPVGHIKLEDLL